MKSDVSFGKMKKMGWLEAGGWSPLAFSLMWLSVDAGGCLALGGGLLALSWKICRWPGRGTWASPAYGCLRIFEFHTWWLRAPEASVPAMIQDLHCLRSHTVTFVLLVKSKLQAPPPLTHREGC